jgi:hypothetical protein
MNAQKELQGILFKNDRATNERAPQYKGSATINGQEYWIGAWIREGKSGGKFMSLSFTSKDDQRQGTASGANHADATHRDEDIRF